MGRKRGRGKKGEGVEEEINDGGDEEEEEMGGGKEGGERGLGEKWGAKWGALGWEWTKEELQTLLMVPT